jgi:hypothetical protein
MQRCRSSAIWLTGILMFAAAPAICVANGEPIAVTPNAGAGKFQLAHDSDHPILAIYGGVGLYQQPNGTWNGYGQKSPKDVEYLIHQCADNGINRIYASIQEEEYPSEITPSPPPGTPDYVAQCIQLAHQNNIAFYADEAIFANVVAKNASFIDQHPGCFTRDRQGQEDVHHMFSPADPDVRRYKRSIMMEWVKNYPIDGLQLDFIRFPYYTNDLRVGFCKFGYDKPLLDAFRVLYGYDSNYLPAESDPRWVHMRSETVSEFLRELRNDLKHSGINLPIGVYNSGAYGRKESLRDVLQDWRLWEEEGLVDEHSPMLLMGGDGLADLARATKSLLDVKRDKTLVLGPIFLAEGFDPSHGYMPTPDMVRDAARRLIKLGCNGLWFCRASEIEQYHLWPVVKEISTWSLKAIRAEEFDPLYENLLANADFSHGFEHWNISPASQARIAQNADGQNILRVQLSSNQPTLITQVVTFQVAHSYMAVDSLKLSASLRADGAELQTSAKLCLNLNYLNDQKEIIQVDVPDLSQAWNSAQLVTKVKEDFNRLVLQRAEMSIRLPPGSGTVEISRLSSERDPLLDY